MKALALIIVILTLASIVLDAKGFSECAAYACLLVVRIILVGWLVGAALLTGRPINPFH